VIASEARKENVEEWCWMGAHTAEALLGGKLKEGEVAKRPCQKTT